MKTYVEVAISKLWWVVVVSGLCATSVSAQEPDALPAAETESAAAIASQQDRSSHDVAEAAPLDRLHDMLEQQQAILEDQKEQLDRQAELIAVQRDSLARQTGDLDDFRELMQSMQRQVDQITETRQEQLSEREIALRERLQKIEQVVAEIPEDPITDMKDFRNSLHIPGSSMSLRIGGFVKMAIVESLDPVGSDDRFIVSSIPVEPDTTINKQVVLSVRQSRLNFEMREATSFGTLRAFIEGDFDGGSGSDDTFRLRHAYGQFRDVLAGKTWSTFMDLASAPEELDFEGLNGRINVRQSQLRFFPEIGKGLNLLIALEDPSPDVTGGTGVSRLPDVVTSIHRTWFDEWNTKASVLLRQIRAEPSNAATSAPQTEYGWRVSLSGRTTVPWWGERDSFMFQINYGDGIGRYIEDLGALGGQDGVFDAQGNLHTLKTFAGYLSMQRWWNSQWRSNFIYGWVRVDTHDFQPADAYESSQRASANLIYSPVAKIDIGGEAIWGRRENRDGQNGDATQLQLSVKYRY